MYIQYSCLENPMDKEEPGGYSLWGRRVGYDGGTEHSCVPTYHRSLA